jgi:hypothetical protein
MLRLGWPTLPNRAAIRGEACAISMSTSASIFLICRSGGRGITLNNLGDLITPESLGWQVGDHTDPVSSQFCQLLELAHS